MGIHNCVLTIIHDKVFDSVVAMQHTIKGKNDQFNFDHIVSGKCRIVAGYTYEWVSKGQ